MVNFDPDKYDYGSDYAKSIYQARDDLEKDYPGARVFICYRDGSKTRSDFTAIRLAPPDGHSDVIRGSFEVLRHLFGTTYGYEYVVFSEGIIEYDGIVGETWLSRTADCRETDGPGRGKRRYTWLRLDGSTAFRTVTSIDAANWMRGLDDNLFLSQLTLPGTHNSHALVGTIQLPLDWLGLPGMIIDSGLDLAIQACKIAECQDLDVKTQLERGVRYLDFRYGRNLHMRHGRVELPGTLRGCMQVVSRFLDDHPGETVVVMAKWDVWDFIDNAANAEPDDVRAAANKVFTDQPRFLDAARTPRLRECRGRIVRKREGDGANHGLECLPRPDRPEWRQPEFQFPRCEYAPGLSAEQNAWLERMHAIKRRWALAEASIGWAKHVRPLANVPDAWDNNGVGDFRADAWSVISRTTIFPLDFAETGNKELHGWLQRECSLAKRYELGVIQLDFAGNQGQDLLTKMILTNFA